VTALSIPPNSPIADSEAQRGDADLAVVGRLLADPGRCRMLLALADGRDLTASALAAEAGVSASTASEHLAQLVGAGMLTAEKHGRHRYFRLAGAAVGDLLESMSRLAPTQQIRSLREGTKAHALRQARSCYDHLAGRLGVAVADAFVGRGWAEASGDTGFLLRDVGRRELAALGVDLPAGDVVRSCVDWTERRPHLAGAHGRALLSVFLERGWVARDSRPRVLVVTQQGHAALRDVLEVDWPNNVKTLSAL
jgi:DNA-binding transcriptional ArsR family regulator